MDLSRSDLPFEVLKLLLELVNALFKGTFILRAAVH